MAMSDDAMMKNSKCMAMMKKMKMTGADMQGMKSCMVMSKDAMMKDQTCSSMMKMHPEMKGMAPK